mmetsp:Transcript_40768/g.81682  ORF Transcript_40768/g.81682 Transcript_40768/m.81682 type:complete len:321 (+) Transcript_40768:671-1633(+)
MERLHSNVVLSVLGIESATSKHTLSATRSEPTLEENHIRPLCVLVSHDPVSPAPTLSRCFSVEFLSMYASEVVECDFAVDDLFWNAVKSVVQLWNEEFVQQRLEIDLPKVATRPQRVFAVKNCPVERVLEQDAGNKLSDLSGNPFVEERLRNGDSQIFKPVHQSIAGILSQVLSCCSQHRLTDVRALQLVGVLSHGKNSRHVPLDQCASCCLRNKERESAVHESKPLLSFHFHWIAFDVLRHAALAQQLDTRRCHCFDWSVVQSPQGPPEVVDRQHIPLLPKILVAHKGCDWRVAQQTLQISHARILEATRIKTVSFRGC